MVNLLQEQHAFMENAVTFLKKCALYTLWRAEKCSDLHGVFFVYLILGHQRSLTNFFGYWVFQKNRKLHLLLINFHIFSKKSKQAILFRNFLHENCVDRKNGVHHDDQRGKTKKIAVSDFSFSKLCHRDFCKTFSKIFVFWKKLKTGHFVSQFSR